MNYLIPAISGELDEKLQSKIDNKTKPLGSLGKLETIALQVGRVQKSLSPIIEKPTMVVFAGDHGIVEEGVSPFPQEVTFQMVMNFLTDGAAINVFADLNDIAMYVVDAGVNHNFDPTPLLINEKIGNGTRNFAKEPAMTRQECLKAIEAGSKLVKEISKLGTNTIGFGEMGIGNTTSASALFSAYSGIDPAKVCGRGTGLDDEGVKKKAAVIEKAMQKHGRIEDPIDILATYGGYEIAMATGAILKAAELGMLLLIDGFIITSALIAAHAIEPKVKEYCIFCHQSDEQGHKQMLEYLAVDALLQLDMRLGEGTGAALAVPLIKASVAFLNKMASFEGAGVSNKD